MDKQNTNIESDPNPFPKLDILPGVGLCRKIGEIIRFVIYFPNDSTIYESGASPALDKALYDSQGEQLPLWNDKTK